MTQEICGSPLQGIWYVKVVLRTIPYALATLVFPFPILYTAESGVPFR